MKYYTYLIGWSKLNIFYYGSRTSSKIVTPEEDFWKTYFTSSEYVKLFRQENGEPDIIQIRKKFDTKEKALEWEKKFLKKVKADKSQNFLNRTIGLGKYHNYKSTPKSEEHKKKIGKAHKGMKHSAECCEKISAKSKNKIAAIDQFGNKIKVDKTDARWLSGELKGVTTGMFAAKDKYGNKYHIDKNDIRYISGELITESKGRKHKSTILKEQKMSPEDKLLIEIKEKFGSSDKAKNTIWITNGTKKPKNTKRVF